MSINGCARKGRQQIKNDLKTMPPLIEEALNRRQLLFMKGEIQVSSTKMKALIHINSHPGI